jgi:bifunctional non-homologous end joining protein LigD
MATAKRPASDRLQTYRQKRDFHITREPAPAEVAPRARGAPLTFMVHKHDARRLHYDLRLEIDGVLASWAIPKGPSYDSSSKRLAVQTEDHPLEYGGFEGRIPDGQYGAGDSIIWDRGTYQTYPPDQFHAQREKGHLVIDLQGEKLNGRWHLVRTHRPGGEKNQWLCFKARDGRERADYDVVIERPESVLSGRKMTRGPVSERVMRGPHSDPKVLLEALWPPMKATLADPEDAPADSWLEVKYDGYRGLAAISGGKLVFHTRNALDLSERFPEIAHALRTLRVGEAVLDGEVVAVDLSGTSRFQLLQTEAAEHRFVAFDLIWLEGKDLRAQPIEERRSLLESLLADVRPPLQLSERVLKPIPEALEEAQERGWEGLIAKRRGSQYVGERSKEWLKLKVISTHELAIAGYSPSSVGTGQVGALHLAVAEGEGFRYAGKVGTGFTRELRGQLWKMLEADRKLDKDAQRPLGAPRERDARWVTPKRVAQITFSEWTADGKLRHPSFQGLRTDKKPEECSRERVVEVASEQHVKLTSPDKKLFPHSGITKREVFEYYREVAPVMVPALAQRPLAFEQWPRGIAQPGVFRQNAAGAPDWANKLRVSHLEGKEVDHLVVDRPETLLWLANQNALTLHAWASREPQLHSPDWAIFDLDPGEGTWEQLIEVATALRRLLEELQLESHPKTSGKRGLHVLVPLARGHTYAQTLEFAISITEALAQGLPHLTTTERSKSKRKGRLYLDALQNGQGKTIVAPYSLRAAEGAPASTPLQWSEVTNDLHPIDFNLRSMRKRLDRHGDLFAPVLRGHQRLPQLKR